MPWWKMTGIGILRLFTTGWFALAIVLAQSAPADVSSETALAEVRELISQGNLDAAEARLQELSRTLPGSGELSALEGEVRYLKGDFAGALKPLQDALQARPGHPKATQFLGAALYQLGRLEEAVPYLERSLDWFPDNVNFQNILVLSYIQTRQAEKSRALYARIFQLDAQSPQAYFVNARMLQQQGINDLARREYQEALQLDPQLPMIHLYLGELLFGERQLEPALAEFEQEIDRNPGMWMSYFRSGEVLFEMGRPKEAVPRLQRAIWLNKFFAGPYLLLGQILLREDNVELALDSLKRAVELDYTDPNAHYLLGRALARAGDAAGAEREFELSRRFREGGAVK